MIVNGPITTKSGINVGTGMTAAAYLSSGNISGDVWAAWGSRFAFNAISARIESRATAIAEAKINSVGGAPTGAIMAFAMTAIPQGWLECDGRILLRSEYPDLFAAIGTAFGDGDGTTSFEIPDLRGIFVRGWDHGYGVDSGRIFASNQTSANKKHNHGGLTSMAGAHWHTSPRFVLLGSFDTNQGYAQQGGNLSVSPLASDSEVVFTSTASSHQHQISFDGDFESRPRNLALVYAIKI